MFCDKYPEFAEPIFVNEKQLDPFRILEKIDWSILNNGIEGACHGDLVLDNIIVNHEKINYLGKWSCWHTKANQVHEGLYHQFQVFDYYKH